MIRRENDEERLSTHDLVSFRRSRLRLSQARTAFGQRSRAVGAAIAGVIGPDEILLGGALLLIAAGFWMVWRPGAFLVPGFALLWIALPSRAAFIVRPPAEKERRKA